MSTPNQCVHDFAKAHRMIQTDVNTIYYGWKQFNANGTQADAIWAVAKKSRASSSDPWVLEWADGDEEYDNVWNNYLSLTYSDMV